MKKLILILLLIPTLANAEYKFADNWTKENTAWQATFLAVTAVDWAQTHWMASNDWSWDGEYYHENNLILGKHPSSKEVDIYMPVAMVAHTLIAMILPSTPRRIWQYVWIGIEGAVVYKNYTIGARIEF